MKVNQLRGKHTRHELGKTSWRGKPRGIKPFGDANKNAKKELS